MDVFLEEGGDALAGFFREFHGDLASAGEAHGVFEDAFRAAEDLGDGVWGGDLVEDAVAREALPEGLVVLQRVEKVGDVAHALGLLPFVTIPVFFTMAFLLESCQTMNR